MSRQEIDAEKYRLLIRWLRNGHIPGAGYGRRIKIFETDPLYGEEKELRNIEALLEAEFAAMQEKKQ